MREVWRITVSGDSAHARTHQHTREHTPRARAGPRPTSRI